MRFFLALISLALIAGIALPAWAAEGDTLAAIMQRGQSVHQLGAAELSLIFLRKKMYWADGKRIQPANLPTDNALRQRFSLRILGGLPESQTDYWNNMYFNGVSPPFVLASQEAMLRFVAETPGAIGYVDACKADARVKVVAWIDAQGNAISGPPPECAAK